MTSRQIISYAIGTEVDAVGLYLFIYERTEGHIKETVGHILKEEIEHISELISLICEEWMDG